MTQKEYLQQNAAGFENDHFARETFKLLIDANGIDVIIETGTYLGSTTEHFAQWVPEVHTIEIKQHHFDQAAKKLAGVRNVNMHLGNSADCLPGIIESLRANAKVFIFLDAHWEDYNPLLDELDIIKDAGIRPIIAIHDFKVPDRPEFGFDSYNGQDYDWDWISEKIEMIYGEQGYTVFYNTEAAGAMRGIIYIKPE